MDHNPSHKGHGKMMWLMMLACLAPILLAFFANIRISKSFIFLIFLACIGGHFIIMRLMREK
ncbi:MAG: hypothetical protein AAB791_03470 [Patescibacteria group bacterium]